MFIAGVLLRDRFLAKDSPENNVSSHDPAPKHCTGDSMPCVRTRDSPARSVHHQVSNHGEVRDSIDSVELLTRSMISL